MNDTLSNTRQSRETIECDVLIVGAGPAGLSAALRLKSQANDAGKELSIIVLDKGSEPGSHILSGAVMDPRALNELIPDWQERGAPIKQPV
ncbi:FAD-dependent oxidoreductase, partial [Salmonella enterica]|nr:FAD-dependent oxidoreductase [Salmonella enterica]